MARVFLFLFALLGTHSMASNLPSPPVAAQKPFSQTWHGKTFEDPYHWLRDKGTPAVEKYLKDENEYTLAQTKSLKDFETALYNEMFGRIKQDDVSAPTKDGAYYYYRRLQKGKQYPVFCRKQGSSDGSLSESAQEEIMLDQNALGEGKAFISLSNMQISNDAKRVAYGADITGFRQYDLFIKDLRTGITSGPLAQRVTSLVWASDNEHIFYTTEDAVTKRSDTVWKLKLGSTPQKILIEDDQLYNIELGRTKDRKFIILTAYSTDTWETKLLNADKPDGTFSVVLTRQKGHKYQVEHRDGWLFLRTNNGAKNFRLVKAPLAKPQIENWEPILAHRDDVLLSDVEVFKDFIAIKEKQAGLNRMRIQRSGESDWKSIVFPDPIYSASFGSSPEFDSKTLRYGYESLVVPKSVYDYDAISGKSTLIKRDEVPGGYEPSQYTSERLWAPARDGKKIPVSIVYKKGLKKDGQAPLWLYAYGSYGLGMSPTFNSNRISLLDRGVVFAIAHIRGGNEMGEAWHDDGMLMKKKNTFNDYIDSADYLIKEKWTSKGRVLAEGGSAGGLLMGAVTNMRPDLFGAVHAAVPFVDVMNTMMDASLPLTVGEYLEWGNPNEKKAFDYMLSYSPYDNIERKKYPPILVTTSYNDSQVMYWEPAKYVAKLRSFKTDQNTLLLKTKMEPAGHGGASGRFDKVRDTAFEYAWMLGQVGIKK